MVWNRFDTLVFRLFSVPLYSPSNVTATPCNSLTPCLLVSWDSLPDSTLYDISGVFQYYKVRYRTVTASFVELIIPNNDTKQDKQDVQLTNLLAYTEYTIQVFMVTLFAHGLPSDVIVVSTRAGGECLLTRAWIICDENPNEIPAVLTVWICFHNHCKLPFPVVSP